MNTDVHEKGLRINMEVSTRPDCPVCKTSSLTGELYKKHNNIRGDFIMVICENCRARVFMTEGWKVIRAEVHYTAEGKIIK